MTDSILLISSSELVQNCVWLSNKIKREKNESFLSESLYRCGMAIGLNIYKEYSCKDDKESVAYFQEVISNCTELLFLLEVARNMSYLPDSKYNFLVENIMFIKKKTKMALGLSGE